MDAMKDEGGAREVPTVERLDPGMAGPEVESEPSPPMGSSKGRRWARAAAIGGAAAVSGLGLGLAVMARTGRLGGRVGELRALETFGALRAVDPAEVRQTIVKSVAAAIADRRSADRRTLAARRVLAVRRAVTERCAGRFADEATTSRWSLRRSSRRADLPPKGERWTAFRPVVRLAALSLALSLAATLVALIAARRTAVLGGAPPADEPALPEPAMSTEPMTPETHAEPATPEPPVA